MNYSILRTLTKPLVVLFLPLFIQSSTQAQDHSKVKSSNCGDFDQYINAKWKSENSVPSTESSWGSFSVLNKSNDNKES